MTDAQTTYRVVDEHGNVSFVTDTELAGYHSDRGRRVTAVARSI
jgi:hypothetical protein